jgi:AcrR family transcriptional regulator
VVARHGLRRLNIARVARLVGVVPSALYRHFPSKDAIVDTDVDMAVESGIATDNGILVDEYCRTNVLEVFAAGDVANHYHPLFGRRMRVEHWQNAMQQRDAGGLPRTCFWG